MRSSIANYKRRMVYAALILLSAGVSYSAKHPARQISAGEKAKVEGTILSRDGDLIYVLEKKSANIVRVSLYEDTKIERKTEKLEFFRHPRMDVTAMLPGLTIEAEGVGNAKGELDARKITFRPDLFAIAVAQQQQIAANQVATRAAQETAGRAQTAAGEAQSSAEEAQTSADRAQDTANVASGDAKAAGDLAVMDAAAAVMLNKRVSELDDYKTVAEASIFFGNGEPVLGEDAKAQLDQLAGIAKGLDGYLIEIAGYASTPGSRNLNQQLSEERAAAVATYLREANDVPMRRILAPAGFGATRAVATSDDPSDRPLDRRVDVKVLVNKGLM